MGIISLCKYCHKNEVIGAIIEDGQTVIACKDCYKTEQLKKIREKKLEILLKEETLFEKLKSNLKKWLY